MMNQGIDQQIQQKVDAYRGKPEALQQRYAQNKQLIDLLALQKLKSEKDAAARDMQMQMQQQPSTIKDQLETEMVQRTKDDMAKQLGDIMQKKQADQKKRASEMGIAANPAPNMTGMGMANGGIVGFAGPQGSYVGAQGQYTPMLRRPAPSNHIYASAIERLTSGTSADTEEERRNRIRTIDEIIAEDFGGSRARAKQRFLELENKGRGSVRNLTPAEAKEFESLRGEFEVSPIKSGITSLVQGAQSLGTQLTTPTTQLAEMGTDEEDPYADQPEVQQPQRPPVPTEDETDYLEGGPQTGAEVTRRVDEALDGQEQPSGIEAIQADTIAVPQSQSTALKGEDYDPNYDESNKYRGLVEDALKKDIAIDTNQVEQDAYERSLGRIGYTDEEKALRQKRIDQLQALYDERMDPKRLRQEEARAFLAAGSQGTGGGIGTVLGRASRGAAAARAQADKAREGQINKLMGVETDLMKETSAQRKEASAQGITRAGQAETRRGQGIEGLLGISDTEARRAEQAAERLLKTDIANVEREDRQRKMELDTVVANANNALKSKIATLEYELGKDKNALTKAYYADSSLQGRQKILSDMEAQVGNIRQKYDEFYAEQIANLQAMPPAGMTPDQVKAQVDALIKEKNNLINESTSKLRTLIDEVRVAAGGMGMVRQK